ncbi:MAG TPA: hypothetical protein VMD30_11435 [Tepidisphaeraceae bacterium]|nr:hypothetical protein [Tepidisphaeraceae bacterium]
MTQPPEKSADNAPLDAWDQHELDQLRRLAKLSMPEKLAWLEEAHRLVRHLQSQSKPPPPNV